MFLPSDWGNLAWSCLSETYLKFFNIPFFDVTIHMINHLSKSESEIDKKNSYVYHIRTIGISYVRCTTISASEEVVYQIRTIAASSRRKWYTNCTFTRSWQPKPLQIQRLQILWAMICLLFLFLSHFLFSVLVWLLTHFLCLSLQR